jgi:FKBP-type peptidyl-prolyl cis-trans isomerase
MRSRFLSVFAVFALLSGPAWAGDISPEANREFMAAFAKKPGAVVLPSGLMYRVVKAGTGQTPAPTDVVTMTYKGTMVDGTVFDQTKPNEPRQLPVSRLIQGWKDALGMMKEGDEWELVVPSDLGYGANRAANGLIPPNETLYFEMHLIAIDRREP